MKSRFLTVLVFLCLLAATAYATNTTHYSYALPTVGASQNVWGSLLNTIFNSIDSNIWSASSGTTIGVNSVSSASNITLTNPINNVQSITLTTTGKNLIFPAMNNAAASPVVGGTITVYNAGSNAFSIVAQDGSTVILSSLTAGQYVYLIPASVSTANGTFNVVGPYLTAVGTLSLGTSAGAPNPAKSGDATTGLFSSASGAVSIASANSETMRVTTGVVVGTTLAASAPPLNGLLVQGNVGIGTATLTNPLEVNGAASVGYTNIAAPSNGLQVRGNVGIGTTTASSPLTVIGNASISGTTALVGGGTTTTAGTNDSSTTIASTGFTNPGNLFGANGYQILPSGIILEWGTTGSISGNSNVSVSFPFTFPNAVYAVQTTWISTTSQTAPTVSGASTTTFTAYNSNGGTNNAYWFAVGR